MAKAKKNSKKSKSNTKKKQASTLMKILEGIVLIGAVAGVIIKFFRGEKSKKKK